MGFWLANMGVALVLCILCAGIIIPQILLIAFRKKLFDVPDARKIHTSSVPRLGGLAFMPVVFFSCVLIIGLDIVAGYDDAIFGLLLAHRGMMVMTLAFLACGVLMLYIVGMADDLIGIKYRAKFIVQLLCAVFLIAGGVWIDTFQGILGLDGISPWFGWPFTVVVTVFIINAINLIDGIDGLASGLSSIAFLIYGIIFYLTGEYFYAIISFGCLGVLIPFFYYNVMGSPEEQRKIFMGDTGSLTIGIMLAFFSIHILQMPQAVADLHLSGANPAALAFVPLLIPCFDVLRVYGERILNHKNPFLPDKRHIHHKLMAMGLPQRQVMIMLLVVSLVFTMANFILSMYVNINFLLFGDLIIWFLAMIYINRTINARKRAA